MGLFFPRIFPIFLYRYIVFQESKYVQIRTIYNYYTLTFFTGYVFLLLVLKVWNVDIACNMPLLKCSTKEKNHWYKVSILCVFIDIFVTMSLSTHYFLFKTYCWQNAAKDGEPWPILEPSQLFQSSHSSSASTWSAWCLRGSAHLRQWTRTLLQDRMWRQSWLSLSAY